MTNEYLNSLIHLQLDPRLNELRTAAKEVRDPTAEDDTLQVLLSTVVAKKPRRILEIGAAEGLTSIAMLLKCDGELTAIELEEERAKRAKENFALFGVEDRVTLLQGDAMEILPTLTGEYDVIFLDGPKVQYRKYLPYLKALLPSGGVLFSDDVLLYGWVSGEAEVPQKRRMLVQHIQEYLKLISEDETLTTIVLPVGQGLAVSVKG